MSSLIRYRGFFPADVVAVETVERALVVAERRIRARTATRAEWLAYRHLIRVVYSQPRHRNAHRRRAEREAVSALRVATLSGILRSSAWRTTKASVALSTLAPAAAKAFEQLQQALARFSR